MQSSTSPSFHLAARWRSGAGQSRRTRSIASIARHHQKRAAVRFYRNSTYPGAHWRLERQLHGTANPAFTSTTQPCRDGVILNSAHLFHPDVKLRNDCKWSIEAPLSGAAMPPHDPRRADRIVRYSPDKEEETSSPVEHVNAVGMVCSLLGLLLKVRARTGARARSLCSELDLVLPPGRP